MIVSLRGTLEAAGQGFAVIDVGGVGLRTLSLPPRPPACRSSGRWCASSPTSTCRRTPSPSTASPAGRSCSSSSSSWPSGASARPRPWPSSPAPRWTPCGRTSPGRTPPRCARIPGVGARLAAQIVLDLKDKMGPLPLAGAPGAPGASAGDGEVLAWLTAMGFAAAEAQSAVARLPKGDGVAHGGGGPGAPGPAHPAPRMRCTLSVRTSGLGTPCGVADRAVRAGQWHPSAW